jgi:hypothetical protein
MRQPLINVINAKGKFNYCNRLNHSYQIALLNRDTNLNCLFTTNNFIRDWKPFDYYLCYPPAFEKIKSKLYNINPERERLKKIKCKICKPEKNKNI